VRRSAKIGGLARRRSAFEGLGNQKRKSQIHRLFSVYTFRTAQRILSLLVCVYTASAQGMAVLSGRVSDASGGAISAATVTVTNTDTGAVRDTVTDAAGRYQAASLPVGHYEVRASKPGFSEGVRTGILLAAGQSATVDLTMRVDACASGHEFATTDCALTWHGITLYGA
jgi:hypothetical protein